MATAYDHARPMGNVAIGKIEDCVFAVLVGRYDAVRPMVLQAMEWIDLAVSRDEKLGNNIHLYRSRLFHARAIASWLTDAQVSEQDWDDARVSLEAAWSNGDRVWTRHEIVTGGPLDDYMAYSFLAGPDHWEAGMEMYEHWMGSEVKTSLSGSISPKQFAYALLREVTGREGASTEKLIAAGRAMLRRNLQENWLGAGQSIRAAMWLMIIHRISSSELSPEQVLLRAYDDMPDVVPPVLREGIAEFLPSSRNPRVTRST